MALTHSIVHAYRKLVGAGAPKVKVGRQYVGIGQPVFIIAEIGLNHNGDMALAKKLIDAAKDAGADAAKFQKRSTVDLLTKEGRDKPYTSPHAYAPTYGEHRDKLEFSFEQYQELKKYCDEKSILFFASVWDHPSTDLMEKLSIDAYKIPSADLMNLPLLEHVAKKGKPVLLSTGMSSEEEIDLALQTVLALNDRVILFHCLSLYPAPHEKLNVAYIDKLIEKHSPVPVGYSGHEPDLLPTLAAVARGAMIIERHLTLDRSMKGSDHAASLTPEDLKELISNVRKIETILGKAEKVMYPELAPLREKLAKSVVTKRAIRKGERITREDLTVKSPGNGIPPTKIDELVGKIAEHDIVEDTLLPVDALRW
jgi:sialic acid synthase SpsE